MDLEKFVDDFMFLCFFVGNDFLPHIPGLRITEGGIDCLMILYKINFPKTGYLTNNGNINLDTLNEFLLLVGAVEDELL
jgi:5'-3' exoribonuclease 2